MSKPADKTTTPNGGGMIKSSLVFSGFTLLSRFAGALRDMVLGAMMGATYAADAFWAAFAFPNLFRRIFAEGAFASAFVPAYTKALSARGEEEADQMASDAMATLAAGAIILTVIAELAMPGLIRLFRPGFADDPAKLKLTIFLTQITMPYLPCMAIYAHLAGVLNARGRFALSAGAPILLNLWSLVMVLPAKDPHQASIFAAAGVIAAGISQAALLVWGCKKSGATVHWRLPRLTPEVKHLLALAVPGAIAASATQINVMVSGLMASFVDGATTWLAVCDRLYQLPQGLVGVAIGVALLPQLSRAVSSGDKVEARRTLDQATVFAMAFALPAAAALMAMPFFLVDGLYTRGEFTQTDALNTSRVLLQYGWGVPAFVLAQITNRAFFAHGDTRTPMNMGLVSVAVNLLAGVGFFFLFSAPGIAAATSLAWWTNVILMSIILHRRGLYTPDRRTISRLLRLVAASAALGLLLLAASHWRGLVETPLARVHLFEIGGKAQLSAKELTLVLICGAGAVVYPLLLFASGGLTLAELKAGLRRPKRIKIEEAVADTPPEG